MFFIKNVPVPERLLRFASGAALAVSGFRMGMGPWTAGAMAVGGLCLALTGLIGFCPMCALVGRKLDKAAKGG
jgi:Protein of unknown function (DUF2892)